MPPSSKVILLHCIALFAVTNAAAQFNRRPQPKTAPPAFSFGGYLGAGIARVSEPATPAKGIQVQAGVFGEWSRHALRPGVDARVYGSATRFTCFDDCSGDTGDGKLIGPRVSYARGIFHPYAEGLFGTGHQHGVLQTDRSSTRDIDGTMKLFVTGIDFDADEHLQVRAFEYSTGSVGSANSVRVQSFTTGIVFRFP